MSQIWNVSLELHRLPLARLLTFKPHPSRLVLSQWKACCVSLIVPVWNLALGPNILSTNSKHLVVAIESEAYVALPKGSLVPSTGSPVSLVPGGGHVLVSHRWPVNGMLLLECSSAYVQIIPIGHHQTLSAIPIDEAIPIMSEIGKFKSRLRAMYNDFGAVPVTFEVARLAGKGGHAHIQVIPIPNNLADQVKKAFLAAGAEMNVDWDEKPDPTPKGNYFKVELPSGEVLVHKLRGTGFNLQFGR